MERQGFRSPPVQVGQELDVKIEAVGAKGDGIAKQNGFVLFVPGVKEGDEVRIKVTKVLRKAGFAEVVGRSEKSDDSAPEEESAEEVQEEEASSEETEESSEDSEDFGNDMLEEEEK